MPPSILKYFDVARLVGAGIQCPACKGTQCRPSRWHSKHEKLGSEGYRPYRCDDCTSRFLAANSAPMERILINGAAGALLGLGVLTAGDLWLDSFDDPKAKRVEPASAVHSKESAPGTEAQRRTGDEASDARKDPAVLAEKLQKAAANGDAGAMVQLGRDLATGNKLTKDVEQAARWIQLAAATGNAEGMFELGRFYRDGLGLTQDSVRAYAWFSRAAAANHLTAMKERDELVLTMSDEKLKDARKLALTAEPAADNVRRK
jgi:hypothetical protein